MSVVCRIRAYRKHDVTQRIAMNASVFVLWHYGMCKQLIHINIVKGASVLLQKNTTRPSNIDHRTSHKRQAVAFTSSKIS